MMKETVISRSVRVMFAGGMAVAMTLAVQPAFAQDANADAAPVARVEVTGSAIKRINAETSVPVTIIKMDDLKKQGITSVEQIMANLSVGQSQQTSSQSVGSSTGGASFADLRGIGSNKTLVLLNGRRMVNNAIDGGSPDLNAIPFAAIERVEVLRDGASSLYGSDAVGGVINFITKKTLTGVTISGDLQKPDHGSGTSNDFSLAGGYGDLQTEGWNVYGALDHQEQHAIGGTDRPFNTRFPGGLSPTTFPANYFQGGSTYNPVGGNCSSATNLIASGATGCQMTTSPFVDFVPKSERTSGLIKGTLKLNADHELGLEYFRSETKVSTTIAPVPYGGLVMNSNSPYYPGNGITPLNGAVLNPAYVGSTGLPDGANPGYINVKFRDLNNGVRQDENVNKTQRFVAALSGQLGAWDYRAAATYSENKVAINLLHGYSNGDIITKGVLDGIINPFGEQTAAGSALLSSAGVVGNVQNAKATARGVDAHASREIGDWFGNGNQAALAIGAQFSHEEFLSAAVTDLAQQVVASYGTDPTTYNVGKRNISSAYAELNVPVLKNLDITGAVRYDKYSDFGNTTNPKVNFRYQPTKQLLVRGSASSGFRAPSLFEINSSSSYTNTSQQDDPANCPGGNLAPGKTGANSCSAQFQELLGGNKKLSPEKSKNFNLGFVVEPVNNLTLGLDFWWVRVKNVIGSLDEDSVFSDPTTYAAAYHRNGAGDLSTDGSQCPGANCGYVDLRTQNLGGIKTNGVDLSAAYRLRTSAFGDYALAYNGTYVDKYEFQNSNGSDWIQNVSTYAGGKNIFKWQNTVNVNWNLDQFNAGVAGHYKSGYADAPNKLAPDHKVSSYTTVDAFGGYNFTKNISLTVGAKNLFDRDPPLTYQTTLFQSGYDARYADPTGRTYYVRGSYTF